MGQCFQKTFTFPDIIYVGMGEPNMRDSHSWGNGVYKSTDGGESWTHLGLEETMKALETVEKGNLAIIQAQETLESLQERVASGQGGDRTITLLNQIEAAATTLSNTLVPVGQTLIPIINEPCTLVVKMQTIHWGLYHSEGAPPASFVQVYEMLDQQFDEASAAWNHVMETDVAELNGLLG